MSVFVVDASLVMKWFVPEERSEFARKWLEAKHDYFAPDLLFPETGNVIWKKVRRGELSADEGRRLAKDLSAIAVEAVPMRALLQDALAVALGAGITVYDATYLTLAMRLETQVVTADDRFAKRLSVYPSLAPHVRSLEEVSW